MSHNPSSSRPTILLDEPLLGLDAFLRDFGWSIVKVRQGISDDGVLRTMQDGAYVLVTPDGILAARCRLKGLRVAEFSVEEQARLIDQILRRDFKT